MKRPLLYILFIMGAPWLFTACSPEQPYLQGGSGAGGGSGEEVLTGGDETRGGGDGCEMSFKHHLGEALAWLSTQEKHMSPEDWAKTEAALFSGPADALQTGQIACECVDQPIIIDGIAKTAGSKKISPPKASSLPHFHSKIQQSRWFQQPLRIRTALACHEALVMAGVEKTGKDDFCRRLLKSDADITPISQLECSRNLNAWDLLKITATSLDGNYQGRIQMRLELRSRRVKPMTWTELAEKAPDYTFAETLSPICWFQTEGGLGLECAQVENDSILLKNFFNRHSGNPLLQPASENVIVNWFNLAPLLAKESTVLTNLMTTAPAQHPLAPADQAEFSECKIQYFSPARELLTE